MNLVKAERDLIKILNQEKLKNFSITSFCEQTGMARATFYRRYKGLHEVYYRVMVDKLNFAVSQRQKAQIEIVFFDLLTMMKKYEIFLVNVYNLSQECFCAELEKQFAIAVIDYVEQHGSYSLSRVKMLSNSLFNIFYHWVAHEMDSSVDEMYAKIKIILKELREQWEK